VGLSVASVVWRWWLLLDRPVLGHRNEAPWLVLWHATLAAQVANIVVPFRLGDSVRIVAASQALGLGPARAASAAIIERLADVTALGLIGAALVFLNVVPEWAHAALVKYSWMAVAITVAVLAALGVVAWYGARRITVLPGPTSLRWAALATIAVPASSLVTNLLVMRAFDLSVPAAAAVLLLVVLQAGTSIVAVPGGLGVSQLLTIKTLAIWNVPPADALAFSFVLYAVARVPKLLMLPFAMAAVGRQATKAAGA
jgi:uncharacterized membrane protein YbhN (UPF0104 family)